MAEVPWQGKPTKVLLHAPKNGFFYVLDRLTGRLLGAEKFGRVNWAERIDLKTGRPVENPEARMPAGESTVYPGYLGAHNWHPMSYNPDTGLVYLPYQEMAAYYDNRGINREKWRAREFVMNSGYQPYREDIPVTEVNSALVAWDPVQQRRAWQVDLPGFWNGGTLTSAGNLVWQGTADGDLLAYRADTGLPLWKYNAGVGISAPPISYAVDERQYVAVLAGWGGASYIGSSAMAQHGWGYGGHTRRLLVFSLEGASEQPPIEPPSSKVAFIDNKTQAIDVAQAAAGQDLYLDNCMACHGLEVISSGAAPDLRGSAVAADLAGFRQLLKTGALQSRGMPRYDELNDREMEQIYWFVRARTRESLAADSSE